MRSIWLKTIFWGAISLWGNIAYGYSSESWSHNPCPAVCGTSTNDPGNWTTYHSVEVLSQCQLPMLLDFAIFTAVDDPSKTKTIRACTASELEAKDTTEITTENQIHKLEIPIQVAWKPTSGEPLNITSVINAVEKMQAFYGLDHSIQPSLFASYEDTAFAVHVGPGFEADAMAVALLKDLIDHVQEEGASETILLQSCDQSYTMGVIVDTGPSRLATVQQAMKHWINGTCISGYENTRVLRSTAFIGAHNVTMTEPSFDSNATELSRLAKRSGCTTVSVHSGDSCGSLATKCGISANEFTKYNPGATLCSTLREGQKVCCSSGGLTVPSKNADGSCATHQVHSGDTCAVIAASNGITTSKIESYNKNTWGWMGCSDIQSGAIICLSEGTPPMPASVSNAVCGPQVPGTIQPTNGTKLADLNPCPLNSCCDVWGQCGITSDYCTDTGTGAPGTAAAGTNGCISNCGNNIVNNDSPPSTFRKIAYFEVFNLARPCLNMGVSQIDISKYTHVHFAFGNITTDFEIDIETYRVAFNQFVNLKGVKRIISLGGWAFSTDPNTYNIFRQGVTAENRETLATNVATFIDEWNLDGVDFDWEYPGEPDIPVIPHGSDENGQDYSLFLAALRKKLPKKSISVAAPASYWYLRGYPVADMDTSVDYWVYMTYDLHGQWDYGKGWASPGCASGNCLRSHVNLTETLDSLAMITKAGVASNKVVVGLSNYGRSFQMTTAGCTGPMCTYTGPASGATPGRCTGQAGLLADAEIYEIIQKDSTARAWLDEDSNSNVLVYDSVQWVSYMDSDIRDSRTTLYKGKNLGGVVEWAIDLEEFENSGSSSLPTSTAPAFSMTASPTAGINGAMNPYLYACTNAQKKMVTEAWEEADILAQGHYEWWPGGKWQDAMTLYLGSNSKNDYSYITGKGPLMSNIEREYLVHEGTMGIQPPIFTYGYFYCDESKVPKSKKQPPGRVDCSKPGTSAYTWDDLGTFYSVHYVVFCPLFFSSAMNSLSSVVESAKGDPVVQSTIDYWKPIRARSLFHETYHWKDTVSKPRCVDINYSPRGITKIARTNQQDAVINAESWALAALAIYLQKVFNLEQPPTPKPSPKNGASGNEVTIAGADIIEGYLNAPPDGWEPPVVNTSKTFSPDMTNISMMSSVGSLTDAGPFDSCVDGLYEDMQQCRQFCGGDDSSCNQSPTNATIVCSGCVKKPPKPVCEPGTYKDMDTCDVNCSGGSCFENAGESGIQCEDCPSM